MLPCSSHKMDSFICFAPQWTFWFDVYEHSLAYEIFDVSSQPSSPLLFLDSNNGACYITRSCPISNTSDILKSQMLKTYLTCHLSPSLAYRPKMSMSLLPVGRPVTGSACLLPRSSIPVTKDQRSMKQRMIFAISYLIHMVWTSSRKFILCSFSQGFCGYGKCHESWKIISRPFQIFKFREIVFY